MNERLLRQGFLGLFLLSLLVILLVQWLWPDTETNENRPLASFPEQPVTIDQWAEFPASFESYMDDNFGFRRGLQRTFHRLIVATGTSPLENILLGHDGWLFTAHRSLTDQHRGAMPLDPGTLDSYVDAFRQQRRWVEGQGARHFLMPLPDKNTIYPEYLPEWARPVQPGRFAQLQDALTEAGEPFVDSLLNLSEAKERGEWIYWQTDTHWNCLGAYHAYQALMDQVQSTGVPYRKRITNRELGLEARPPSVGGDMSQMLIMEDILLERRDVSCRLVFQDSLSFSAERLKDGAIHRNFIARPKNEVWRYRQDVPVVESKVLLFRDSFAHLLLPYLVKSFDELVVAPHGELEFDEQLVLEHQPDLVIYQFVERDLIVRPERDQLAAPVVKVAETTVNKNQ